MRADMVCRAPTVLTVESFCCQMHPSRRVAYTSIDLTCLGAQGCTIASGGLISMTTVTWP